MSLKQTFVEHLHKHFAMKTFNHLEQPFADDQLNDFLVILEGYSQHHNFLNLKTKPSCQIFSNALEISRKVPLILVGGWQSKFYKFHV